MRFGPETFCGARPRRIAYSARQAPAFMGAAMAEPPGLWIQFCSAVTVRSFIGATSVRRLVPYQPIPFKRAPRFGEQGGKQGVFGLCDPAHSVQPSRGVTPFALAPSLFG